MGLKLEGITNCWVLPDGKVFEVGEWGHDSFAWEYLERQFAEAEDVFNFDYGTQDALKMGWLKLSRNEWFCKNNQCTQAQFNVMADWHIVNGKEFRPLGYDVI